MLVSVLPVGTAVEPETLLTMRRFGVDDPVIGAFAQLGLAAAPPVERNWPLVPGARMTHAVALRYSTEPCVEPNTLSKNTDAVSGTGAALEPLMFARNDAVAIAASAT